jgi:4-amino-4-deoxy-L-arabinose transferase-like glycosyltransferase
LGAVKIAFAVIVVILGGIIMSFTSIDLPLTAQRALCFLPGNWDPQAVSDAKDSSEWRFELWEIALTSERYIHNKIFGDGFGYMRSDYERARLIESGLASLMEGEVRQEMFLLDGDFHSGPISTIRFVGYVGLALFIPLLFLLAGAGYRIIRESIGTPFQVCSFFIGVPIIILPFFSIFIFGDYRSDLVTILYGTAMLKMLSASLKKYNEERVFAVKGYAAVNAEPSTVSV